jgi:FixJ family two-component response regulator
MPQTQDLLRGRTILLVEDEYMIAVDMADLLQNAGARVLGPVASADDAIDLIDDHLHDLDAAVLDVNLGPGKTAYPIADRLAEVGVPYVFATGDVQVLRSATGPVLEKPVLEADLLKAVLRLMPAERSDKADAEHRTHVL